MSEEERDLEVIMHKSAKPSRQCAEALKGQFNLRYGKKKHNGHQKQGFNTRVAQITVGLLHPGMKSIPEIGHKNWRKRK